MRCWTRRALGAGLATLALLGLAPLAPADASVPVLVLDGTGYGHGVGMCQWGAIGRARAGQDAQRILATYFPGTSIGRMPAVGLAP